MQGFFQTQTPQAYDSSMKLCAPNSNNYLSSFRSAVNMGHVCMGMGYNQEILSLQKQQHQHYLHQNNTYQQHQQHQHHSLHSQQQYLQQKERQSQTPTPTYSGFKRTRADDEAIQINNQLTKRLKNHQMLEFERQKQTAIYTKKRQRDCFEEESSYKRGKSNVCGDEENQILGQYRVSTPEVLMRKSRN